MITVRRKPYLWRILSDIFYQRVPLLVFGKKRVIVCSSDDSFLLSYFNYNDMGVIKALKALWALY